MLQGSNKLFTNEDIDINPWTEYARGNCLFSFDLSPEMQSGCTYHFDLIRDGTVDVKVKLAVPTEHSVTMVAHLEFDHLIEMTKDGDIVSEP